MVKCFGWDYGLLKVGLGFFKGLVGVSKVSLGFSPRLVYGIFKVVLRFFLRLVSALFKVSLDFI